MCKLHMWSHNSTFDERFMFNIITVHKLLNYEIFLVCHLIYLNTNILYFQAKIGKPIKVCEIGKVQNFV